MKIKDLTIQELLVRFQTDRISVAQGWIILGGNAYKLDDEVLPNERED